MAASPPASKSGKSMRFLSDWLDRRYPELLQLDGVNGVAVAFKEEGGRVTTNLAIRFDVSRKRTVSEAVDLTRAFQGEDLLPEDIDVVQSTGPQVPPFVQTSNPEQALPNQHRIRRNPIQPGISVGNVKITAGTIGAVVYNASGEPHILSNWHVLDGGYPDAGVLQPGTADGGRQPTDLVARERVRSVLDTRPGDAAIAKVVNRRVDPTPLGLRSPPTGSEQPSLGLRLTKSGRTTGVTHGVITAYPYYARINYGSRTVNIRCFEIESLLGRYTEDEISMGGDSGSLWVRSDDHSKAVGLHFAGESSALPDLEYAFACPIDPILQYFQVGFHPRAALALEARGGEYEPLQNAFLEARRRLDEAISILESERLRLSPIANTSVVANLERIEKAIDHLGIARYELQPAFDDIEGWREYLRSAMPRLRPLLETREQVEAAVNHVKGVIEFAAEVETEDYCGCGRTEPEWDLKLHRIGRHHWCLLANAVVGATVMLLAPTGPGAIAAVASALGISQAFAGDLVSASKGGAASVVARYCKEKEK